ncbi:MAG TPA: HNH endonuclease signature motif containing protein [Candidatus Binataceae bacterium]|nr:HNH endonuclease signature motif containing protein [Candidatus Binataceae bacterium]
MVGVLRLSAEDGLQVSLEVGDPPKTLWWEALPNAFEWPGLGKYPEFPNSKAGDKAAQDEFERACTAYRKALHADPAYRSAASDFVRLQQREPQPLELRNFWVYKQKVLRLDSDEPEPLRDREKEALLVKHHVLRQEKYYEKVRREVEALENLEKLEGIPREPIAESVRLFVWQRDQGKCVKCGSNERLEFDHIIPVVKCGGNTERNIQLLCESCNRAKGSTI